MTQWSFLWIKLSSGKHKCSDEWRNDPSFMDEHVLKKTQMFYCMIKRSFFHGWTCPLERRNCSRLYDKKVLQRTFCYAQSFEKSTNFSFLLRRTKKSLRGNRNGKILFLRTNSHCFFFQSSYSETNRPKNTVVLTSNEQETP